MSKLILVRHSSPEIVPNSPAAEWRLSDEGRRRCTRLAEELADHRPTVVVASNEPKATETGQIVARLLGLPFETADSLHEHDRSDLGWLGSSERFEAAVASLFNNPDSVMLGKETADQAHQRFSQAVGGVVEGRPEDSVTIVSHGTVIALFVARITGLEPLPLWQRLDMPSFVVMALPKYDLLTVVESVES